MPIQCRHETQGRSSSHNDGRPTGESQPQIPDAQSRRKDGYSHVIDIQQAPEKQFEPWALPDRPANRTHSTGNEVPCAVPSRKPSESVLAD